MDCTLSMHGMALEFNWEVWNMCYNHFSQNFVWFCGCMGWQIFLKCLYFNDILSPVFATHILVGVEQSLKKINSLSPVASSSQKAPQLIVGSMNSFSLCDKLLTEQLLYMSCAKIKNVSLGLSGVCIWEELRVNMTKYIICLHKIFK